MWKGSGYLGSESPISSEEGNYQIIPDSPDHWTSGYKFYKFEFKTIEPTEVIVRINDGNPIYLNDGYFATEIGDAPINSFVVLTPETEFTWLGGY